jgi:hypothetical protein
MTRKTLYKVSNYFVPMGLKKRNPIWLSQEGITPKVGSAGIVNPVTPIKQALVSPTATAILKDHVSIAPSTSNFSSGAHMPIQHMVSEYSGSAPMAEVIPHVPPPPDLSKNAPGNSLLWAGLIATVTVGFLIYVGFFWKHSDEN